MSTAASMLEHYPKSAGGVDGDKLLACIEACVECEQVCTACADACLGEDAVAQLAKCVRTNLDCADVCGSAGRVLSRHTGYDANLTATVVQACAVACRVCADECDNHGGHHEHCRICAEVCRRCQRACEELLSSVGEG